MQTILVQKGGKANRKLTTVHALLDPERTFCGRKPAELDVIEELELEKLPALNGCRGCLRSLEGWEPPEYVKGGGDRWLHAGGAPGRSRAVGPLAHGTRISRGNRIGH